MTAAEPAAAGDEPQRSAARWPTDAATGWPTAAATGVGSMPGTDIGQALGVVFDELPDLPHLPELPARGPGAELVGRGAALLAGIAVDLQPAGWRVVARPGLDVRRARDFLARDLDALEAAAADLTGPMKIQAAGPWTLAASVELTRGDKLLADPGAVRDVGQSLTEGLLTHLTDVRRRVPRARVLVQLDEPMLPRVLAGRVPTASGFDVLPRPEPTAVTELLAGVLRAVEEADAIPLVHCCAPDPPIRVARAAGAAAVSVDLRLDIRDDDLGEALDSGMKLLAGVASPGDDAGEGPAAAAAPARALWRRLGFPPEQLPGTVVLTPTCGLAGVPPEAARAVLRRCRQAARALAEEVG